MCGAALVLFHALGNKRDTVQSLAAHTALTAATDQIVRTARLAGAVDALLRSLGAMLDPLERRMYNAAVQAAHAQFGAANFNALWAEGQAMTLEQAIAYALGDDQPPAESSSQAG
jgi:hypothetical protein